MTLEPITIKEVKRVVARLHRRHPELTGAMWAVALRDGDRLVGAATVGRPEARLSQDGARRLVCTRVAVEEGVPNGCSMLYGAVARAARAMGAVDLWTYTHADEPGTSLRAAGWIREEREGSPIVFGGGQYGRPCRPRKRRSADKAGPKHRWWAPWSRYLAK